MKAETDKNHRMTRERRIHQIPFALMLGLIGWYVCTLNAALYPWNVYAIYGAAACAGLGTVLAAIFYYRHRGTVRDPLSTFLFNRRNETRRLFGKPYSIATSLPFFGLVIASIYPPLELLADSQARSSRAYEALIEEVQADADLQAHLGGVVGYGFASIHGQLRSENESPRIHIRIYGRDRAIVMISYYHWDQGTCVLTNRWYSEAIPRRIHQ